eukprot:312741_1
MNTLFVYCAAAIMVGINGDYLGAIHKGVKTVFETVDLDANNNCEWEKSRPMTDHSVFPYGMYTAVDTELFDDGISCGECYELKCVKPIDTWGKCSCKDGASVTVMIVDWGHDAALPYTEVFDSQGHVAREILSGDCLNDGSKYEITYQQVCCDHQENIKVYNYEGTTRFWLSFVVAEVRGYGSITNFYMREDGRTNWYECKRSTYGLNANFVCDPWTDDYANYKAEGVPLGLNQGPYLLPISIKITDSNGDTLKSSGLIKNFNPEEEFDFGDNFKCKK